jgi:hypothetical protein
MTCPPPGVISAPLSGLLCTSPLSRPPPSNTTCQLTSRLRHHHRQAPDSPPRARVPSNDTCQLTLRPVALRRSLPGVMLTTVVLP